MSFSPQSTIAHINGADYNLIAFYYPGHNTPWDNVYQAPFLGNFWESPLTITIDSITATFHTSEAAFQATKWWHHSSIRIQFENALTGDEAFRIKKHLSVAADYGYAGLGREKAMMVVLEAKFKDPILQAGLLATNNAYLLEHNSVKGRDDHWSDDHDGTGLNMLGISLMNLRQNLGGQASPYTGSVADMTNNVKTAIAHPTVSVSTADIKIVPSVFSGDNKDGDFGWMIRQSSYADSFFIFNDNVSQFEAHQNDPDDPNGCSIGGGNAVIRPYQCKTPAQAGGIPTGPSFTSLTPKVKDLIDTSIQSIKRSISAGNYKRIFYSSDGHGGLGTSIFLVPEDVKKYIVSQINGLA